jgi:hypothetical protein
VVRRGVQELGHELPPPRVGAGLQQPGVGVERNTEEVGCGELVGAGFPEPLTLGDQVAALARKQSADFLTDAESVNKTVKLLDVTVGDGDFALAGSKALSEVLKRHGVRHELKVTGGGHTWINWRQYLNDLAPRLFR